MKYKIFVILFLQVGLSACDGGGARNSASGANASAPATTSASPPALPSNNASVQQCPTTSAFSLSSPPPQVAGDIVGRITYDRIPFSNNLGSGLDYANQQALPARGVVVEALASSDGQRCDGGVTATTLSDGDGWYRLTPVTAKVCVRVRAQLYRAADKNSPADWNFAVADNTSGNALYAVAEANASDIDARPRRDLHMSSGWSGGGYAGARIAAPFAILDTACKAMNAVLAERGTTVFGGLTFFWSIKNTSDTNGTLQQGKIGGVFFDRKLLAIYLRGDAAVNTDEFDEMVIAHEFGHFVTFTLSRSDNIGGDHSLLDYEDPRLAFEEGWATAFAGLALHSSTYRDSDEVATANSPSREFYFDITQHFSPVGWYSESSIQRALFTLGRDVADGGNGMGLGALLQSFAGNYKQTDALASIFSYGERLQRDQLLFANAIASVLDLEQINGDALTAFADNENHAPSNFDLPVYRTLDASGSKQTICSSNAYGTENALSNRRYLRFVPPQMGRYQFNVQPISASGVAGIEVIDRGSAVLTQLNASAGTTLTANTDSALQSGRSYVLSVFHTGNVVKDSPVAAADQCFQVWAKSL